jgi:uncharacterized protein YjfI (DUF2170 family)
MTDIKTISPEQNIDAIRQILFGQEQKQFSENFSQVNQRLDALVKQIASDKVEMIQKIQWQENVLLNQMTGLQAAQKREFDDLAEKIALLKDGEQAIQTQYTALSRELGAQAANNHTAIDTKFNACMLQTKTLLAEHQAALEQVLQQTKSIQVSELSFKTKLKQLVNEFVELPHKSN